MIFGEITTSATVNYEAVIRETLKDIGYDDPAKVLRPALRLSLAFSGRVPQIAPFLGWGGSEV